MVAEAILTVFFPTSVMENYCQKEGTLCAPNISRVCNLLLGGRVDKYTGHRWLPTTFILTMVQGRSKSEQLGPHDHQAANYNPLFI